MSYMKNLDLSERFSKLTDAQKTAVINIKSGGTETIRPVTYKALESRGLIVKVDEAWELEEGFNAEIMEAINRPEPREVDGDFTPENIARAIEDIDSESDEAPVPYFNRKARREFKRSIARYNRRLMREHGKRIRKFGPQNVIIRYIAA